jgi:hypothetical protein
VDQLVANRLAAESKQSCRDSELASREKIIRVSVFLPSRGHKLSQCSFSLLSLLGFRSRQTARSCPEFGRNVIAIDVFGPLALSLVSRVVPVETAGHE